MNLPLPSAIPIVILLKDCNSKDDAIDDNHTWINYIYVSHSVHMFGRSVITGFHHI